MTDRDLVDGVLAGRRDAADQFVLRYSRLVFGILARSFRLSPAVCDDLYQTVFMQLWADDCRRMRMWRGGGDFVDYLAPIVRNVARDHLRKVGRRPESESPEEWELESAEPGPENEATVAEQRRLVDGIVATLEPRDRRLYELRYRKSMKYKEIADELRMSVNHVGVALLRLEKRVTEQVRGTLRGDEPRPTAGKTVRSSSPGTSAEPER